MPSLPEPIWDEPQDIACELPPSSFKSTGTRPSHITGALKRLLEAHFSRATNISDEQLRPLIWRPDSDDENDQPKIHIKSWHEYDPTHLQQRPALYISRGPISTQRIALKDKALTHITSRTGNLEGAEYIKLITGRHQVICCAPKSDMAADRLGEEVYYLLLEYGPAIQQDFTLAGFHVNTITESQEIDDDHENFMVGVQITWTNAHSWKLKPIAPILKGMAMSDELN